jgi:hypothetical protein
LLALPFVLDITFPKSYNSSTSVFSIVNFNIFEDLGISCLHSSYDYITSLLYITIFPVIILLLIGACYITHTVIITGHIIQNQSTSTHQYALNDIKSKYFSFFLYFTYFVLPSISTTIFRTFSCQNIDPDNNDSNHDNLYMRADYSISCNSNRYYFGRNYAIVMIFIYPIGIPLYYFYLLYSVKDYIKNRYVHIESSHLRRHNNAVLSPLRILFDAYKPHFW